MGAPSKKLPLTFSLRDRARRRCATFNAPSLREKVRGNQSVESPKNFFESPRLPLFHLKWKKGIQAGAVPSPLTATRQVRIGTKHLGTEELKRTEYSE